jgi:chemotaxis protein CheD
MTAGCFVAPPASSDSVPYSEAILWAGDLVAETAPVRMTTVLGSCVSVCLFDAQRQFGGMNHFLVPYGGSTAIHGEWATTRLVERMRELGSTIGALQGKVFGGGCPLRLVDDTLAVGAKNVATARQVLGSFGIPITAERVGHAMGLRLFFENWTGVVWVRSNAGKENHE